MSDSRLRLTYHQGLLRDLIRTLQPVRVEAMPKFNARGPRVNVLGEIWANMAALDALERKGLIVRNAEQKWECVSGNRD